MTTSQVNWELDFEPFVRDNLGINYQGPLDRNAQISDVCKYYLKGVCFRGHNCPFKHTRSEKSVVCKHWLRGLCKKGEACEFLHEYNLKKMPECWFFTKYGECANFECIYQHIDPNAKGRECVWYGRGFCKHGPNCRNKHIRNALCPLYVAGFCPHGPQCELGHPKWDLSVNPQQPGGNGDDSSESVSQQQLQQE
jgi:cleavage and polyadenylation specificity factor subunit 4